MLMQRSTVFPPSPPRAPAGSRRYRLGLVRRLRPGSRAPRRQEGENPARKAGFSLVELMIVVLLTAILAAAGFELGQGIVTRHRLQSGCEVFVSAVERARSLAVARNGTFEIRIHPSRRSFAVAPAGFEAPVLWRHLPPGVEFRRYPSSQVAFHSRGAAAPAGSFSLAASNREVKVVVAVSGRIRWESVG